MEPTEVEITGTRKTVVLSIVGAVLVIALAGTFIPEAREYAITITKNLLSFIPTIIK